MYHSSIIYTRILIHSQRLVLNSMSFSRQMHEFISDGRNIHSCLFHRSSFYIDVHLHFPFLRPNVLMLWPYLHIFCCGAFNSAVCDFINWRCQCDLAEAATMTRAPSIGRGIMMDWTGNTYPICSSHSRDYTHLWYSQMISYWWRSYYSDSVCQRSKERCCLSETPAITSVYNKTVCETQMPP